MTLAAASTGAGWWNSSNKLQRTREGLSNLCNLCSTAIFQKDKYNRQIQDYQARLPDMHVRKLNLQDITAQVNDLYVSLFEDESFKKVDITNALSILSIVKDKVVTFIAFMDQVPELIQACQKILAELDGWFSERDDIDSRLFRLLQQDLFHSIDDIHAQTNSLDHIQ